MPWSVAAHVFLTIQVVTCTAAHTCRSPVHLGAASHAADPAKAAQMKLHFEPLTTGAGGKPRVGVRLVSGTPTPANSFDSQSHGSADTAAAGHAVHSRPARIPSPSPADYHPIAHEDHTPPLFKSAPVTHQQEQPQQQGAVVMPSKLGMKLAKMEAQGGSTAWGHPQQQQQQQALHLEHEQPRTPPRHAALLSTAEQRLGSLAEAAEVLEGGRRSFQQQGLVEGDDGGDRGEDMAVAGPFVKALDYKSCDHILCLTKDMARELFPPAPHSSAGAACCLSHVTVLCVALLSLAFVVFAVCCQVLTLCR